MVQVQLDSAHAGILVVARPLQDIIRTQVESRCDDLKVGIARPAWPSVRNVLRRSALSPCPPHGRPIFKVIDLIERGGRRCAPDQKHRQNDSEVQ